MKTRTITLSILLYMLLGCNSNEKRTYQGVTTLMDYTIERSNRDSILKFFSKDDGKFEYVGFLKNGFQNGAWSYIKDDKPLILEWGYYHDKELKFSTNVLTHIDSIRHGKYSTQFSFLKPHDRISLTISVNSPMKDSLDEEKYESRVKADLSLLNIKLAEFRKRDSYDENLHLSEAVLQNLENGHFRFLTTAWGFLPSGDFVEISVGSSNKIEFAASKLFDAVIENFYFKNQRLYNPFQIRE